MSLSERAQFLRAFFRNPQTIGSIIPSSRYVARALAGYVSPSVACVAELGAGTGPITRALLERVSPAASVLAFETDPALCAFLRQALLDPRLSIINAPAQELSLHLAKRSLTVGAVVSSLPFANFPLPVRRAIVGAAYRSLVPGGTFVGYSYGSPNLKTTLKEVFGNCQTEIVLRNLPPAFVSSAHKSVDGRAGALVDAL